MKTNFRTTINNQTIYGNRRKTKNGGRILLKNKHDGEVFAALVKNSDGYHLVNCTTKNNKPFYMFCLSELSEKRFGLLNLRYSEKREKIEFWGKAFLD